MSGSTYFHSLGSSSFVFFCSWRLEDGKYWLARSLFFSVCSTILSSRGCTRVAQRNDPEWGQGQGQVDIWGLNGGFQKRLCFTQPASVRRALKNAVFVSNYNANVCCFCLPSLNRFLCLWYNEKDCTITVLSPQILVTKYSMLMKNYFNCFGCHLQYVRVAKR